MATQTQLTIRRDEAYQRIAQSVNVLAARFGVTAASLLGVRHRDPHVEQAQRLELVAATLEAIDEAATPALPSTDLRAAIHAATDDELAAIPGVGAKTVDALRAWAKDK